uniref:Uncharacterized protein n=1 Tax=Bionectria ochroleuca TaxID=29856 RepID=A0A8H7TTX9_BIOOC
MLECLVASASQSLQVDEEKAAYKYKGDIRVRIWRVGHQRDEPCDGLVVLVVEHSLGGGNLIWGCDFMAHKQPVRGAQRRDGVTDQGFALCQRGEGSSPEVLRAVCMNNIPQRTVEEVAEEAQLEGFSFVRKDSRRS